MSYFQYDRSGRSLGVAYVQFSNSKDAKMALERLNGVVAKGESLDKGYHCFMRLRERCYWGWGG